MQCRAKGCSLFEVKAFYAGGASCVMLLMQLIRKHKFTQTQVANKMNNKMLLTTWTMKDRSLIPCLRIRRFRRAFRKDRNRSILHGPSGRTFHSVIELNKKVWIEKKYAFARYTPPLVWRTVRQTIRHYNNNDSSITMRTRVSFLSIWFQVIWCMLSPWFWVWLYPSVVLMYLYKSMWIGIHYYI